MEANGLSTPNNVIFGEIQMLLAKKFRSICDCRR
jgi:hypothetical protein